MLDPTEIDWNALKEEVLNDVEPEWNEDNEVFVFTQFIGTVMSITPSGKYYTPWTSNVTEEEAERDQAWWKLMEHCSEQFGMYLHSSEGDPCDVLLSADMTMEELLKLAEDTKKIVEYRSQVDSHWRQVESKITTHQCPFHGDAELTKDEMIKQDIWDYDTKECKFCLVSEDECNEYGEHRTDVMNCIDEVIKYLGTKMKSQIRWDWVAKRAKKIYDERDKPA